MTKWSYNDNYFAKGEYFMNAKKVLLPFGKTIYQTEIGHGVTGDTATLVDTVINSHSKKNINLLELGSGNGIISIMLAHYRPLWKIIGLEIQKSLFELSEKNKKELDMQNISFMNTDFNDYKNEDKFDIIVSNPPYYSKNQGKISPIKERAIARHEIKTNIKKVLFTIAYNIAKQGDAYIIYPQIREKDMIRELKNIDLICYEKKIIFEIKNTKIILFHLKKEEK